jgi:hypothetical protein
MEEFTFTFYLLINSLRAERSGLEPRWWARFSTPLQTCPGAHPLSSTMVFFREVNRSLALTTHPEPKPRLKKQESCTCTPAFVPRMACYGAMFTFTVYLLTQVLRLLNLITENSHRTRQKECLFMPNNTV